MESHINVGCGGDLTIGELAELIKAVVGYKGVINFDSSKPDGAPRKWMDSSKLQKLGWTPSVSLVNGLEQAYQSFLESK